MPNDSTQPATKADVRSVADDVDNLAQATKQTFDRVEADLHTIKTTMATKQQVATILEIVQSIDARNKESQDIPERVERLEDIVLKPHR